MQRKSVFLRRITMIFSIILSGLYLAGCSINGDERQVRYIDENTPWYECETVTYDIDEIGDFETTMPIYADPDIQLFARNTDPVSGQYCNVLCISDKEGNVISVDMQELFPDSEEVRVYNCFREGDEHYLLIRNTQKGEEHSCIYRLMSSEEALEFCFEIKTDDEHPGLFADKVISRDNKYYAHCYYLDGYRYRERFVVVDERNNEITGFDVDEEALMWTLGEDNNLLYIGLTHNTIDGELDSYKLSIEDGTVKKLNIDPDVLNRYRLGTAQNDGYFYLTNYDLTLTKLDPETGEEYLVLDYNNSNASLSDIREGRIFYCDDNNVVISKNTLYPSEPKNLKTYVLTKADSNPNAGKQIVTAATYFLISPVEANAILEYNSSANNLYICLTMDYSQVTFTDYEMSDDSSINAYNKDLALLASLKNDIRAGKGPDILLHFGDFATLYCDDYLCDLSGIINDPERFNREDFFDNYIDAYAIDGKMYQVPVSIGVNGIYAYEEFDEGADCGFSFNEYREYIESYCDGIDPLADNYRRDLCFEYLIKSNYEALHDGDGRINLDNDCFRAICDYCRDCSEDDSPINSIDGACYVGFSRVHFDLSRMLISTDKQLYGLPSYDGANGPVAHCIESVAITSCASDPEELFGFVSTMLSYDIQITNVSYNPINRDAFRYYAEDAIDYSNAYILAMSGKADYNGEEMIDEYIGYLESADMCYLADDYSLLILKEELEPYYAGQKTLDDVIPIAESRINNMIEENR